MYMAAERGHKEIVEYLVGEKKADITIKDKSGVSTYMYIILRRQYGWILYSCVTLLSASDNRTQTNVSPSEDSCVLVGKK